MILGAHQPAYIPWSGFIHKILSSEIFVILDNIQFEKNSFINRNHLLINNEPKLLTVPIEIKNHLQLKIKDIKISNQTNWRRKHLQSIHLNYNRSPFYKKHISFFENIYNKKWSHVCEINSEILNYILEDIKSDTKIIKLSELEVEGKKTQLLVNLCKKLDCNYFLFGNNGIDYADLDLGKKENIKFLYQEFNNKNFYDYQKFKFKGDISILDLLFKMESSSIKEYILLHGKVLNLV